MVCLFIPPKPTRNRKHEPNLTQKSFKANLNEIALNPSPYTSIIRCMS